MPEVLYVEEILSTKEIIIQKFRGVKGVMYQVTDLVDGNSILLRERIAFQIAESIMENKTQKDVRANKLREKRQKRKGE